MGSYIELNDTLRISKSQGFPLTLEIGRHLKSPYSLKDYSEKVFEFHDKPSIRLYQIPPVRCFLVEEIEGKWVYWGLCHIIEIIHDYIKQTTAGKFKIIYINTPEEVRLAHKIIDQRDETNYFKS